jgi:hypothetical protein
MVKVACRRPALSTLKGFTLEGTLPSLPTYLLKVQRVGIQQLKEILCGKVKHINLPTAGKKAGTEKRGGRSG